VKLRRALAIATTLVLAATGTTMLGERAGAVGEVWSTIDTTSLTVVGSGLAYGDGVFVGVNCATGMGNEFLVSSDGSTWMETGTATDICMAAVTYGDGKFVAVSRYDRHIHVSSDGGLNWTAIDPTVAHAAEWTAITYGGGRFVAVSYSPGRKVLTSLDAVTWTAIDADVASSTIDQTQWRDVAYGNGRFVAVSHFGRSMSSLDGVTWTVTTGLPVGAYDVAFGNGTFVAVSNAGASRVMTSTDGVNWTAPSLSGAPATSAWNDITWDPTDGRFVAVGTAAVMTSPDGEVWFTRSVPAANTWQAVIAGADMLIAASSTGSGNRIMTSGTYSYTPPTVPQPTTPTTPTAPDPTTPAGPVVGPAYTG